MPPLPASAGSGVVVRPPDPPRLFLVDGYALIYRAFFALMSRPLRTAKGENTSAAWGVVTFLQRLVEKHRPEYLGWVHDAGTSFRHDVYPEYKATREKLGEELQADFDLGLERIGQLLDAYRVPVLTLDGYEADDIIGTLTRQALDAHVNVVIVSGDKDFQQLVRPGVWLLNPGRGGPASVDEQWVGVENGTERMGVSPSRVIDYLALVGDSSDNVPGVPGIGEKTAQELVNRYGDLESILTHAEEITKKRPREALLAHGDRARLSKNLVSIHSDVPVTLALEKLQMQAPDLARLRQLFVELEFTSLLRALEAPTPEPSGQVGTFATVDSAAALQQLVDRIRAAGRMALSIGGLERGRSGPATDALRTELTGLGVAVSEGEGFYVALGHTRWQPAQGDLLAGSKGAPEGTSLGARRIAAGADPIRNLGRVDSAELGPLRSVLEDPGIHKIGHDLKFSSLVLRNVGITLRGLAFDTMLASYVLDPGRLGHSLEVVAQEFLGEALSSYEALCGKGKLELPFDTVPVETARDYCGAQASAILRLHDRLSPQLDQMAMRELFEQIELPLVNVLGEMEWVGVAIDIPWFRNLKERFQRERRRVEEEIYVSAGERFNINSNLQLRQVLFEKLELPVRKKTSTGPSTDASVLQELAEEGHQLPVLLMEYRELSKLESTYLDTLPELVLPRDGRLHTSYNQTVAATGRLSSSDPNLQNIPIRRELGRDIRRGFVPRAGWKLLAADYSQIELRLLAHLSGDPAFVEAFRGGRDIHRETAAIIFGVPGDEVTSDMRARAKTINFATIYGQGANALSRQLRITTQEAKDFIATYFERFRGVREYLDGMVSYAKSEGFVQTIFHRRRYIPELKERNFNIRAFGERVATNAPIQGSAADLIKLAMIRIHQRIQRENLKGRMILQVHDELVFEAPPDEVEAFQGFVRTEMEGAAQLNVPLVVDIGVGDNWVDAKH
jgi:DNA polymerase-1